MRTSDQCYHSRQSGRCTGELGAQCNREADSRSSYQQSQRGSETWGDPEWRRLASGFVQGSLGWEMAETVMRGSAGKTAAHGRNKLWGQYGDKSWEDSSSWKTKAGRTTLEVEPKPRTKSRVNKILRNEGNFGFWAETTAGGWTGSMDGWFGQVQLLVRTTWWRIWPETNWIGVMIASLSKRENQIQTLEAWKGCVVQSWSPGLESLGGRRETKWILWIRARHRS